MECKFSGFFDKTKNIFLQPSETVCTHYAPGFHRICSAAAGLFARNFVI